MRSLPATSKSAPSVPATPAGHFPPRHILPAEGRPRITRAQGQGHGGPGAADDTLQHLS